MITVRDLVPEVLSAIPPASLATYSTGIHRLAAALGDKALKKVTLHDLERLRDDTRRAVGEETVRAALASHKQLRSYDADAYGRGAAENLVRGVRFYFKYAVKTKKLKGDNPAAELRAPRRPPAPERPLTPHELEQIWTVVATTGDDPDLDVRLLTFLRHTAARREGSLNLAIDHLDSRRETVTLTEKMGYTRTLPLQAAVAEDLRRFAGERGAAAPGDRVFRHPNGKPISRGRFVMIFNRVDRHLGWTQPLDVGPHWIRHTTLSDIVAVSDLRVAEAYAGHTASSLGTIGTYTKVTPDDLRAAYLAVFGR